MSFLAVFSCSNYIFGLFRIDVVLILFSRCSLLCVVYVGIFVSQTSLVSLPCGME